MRTGEPSGWLNRAVGACFSILACAAALYFAVHLIEAIAAALVIIVLVGLLIVVPVAILRARNRGW